MGTSPSKLSPHQHARPPAVTHTKSAPAHSGFAAAAASKKTSTVARAGEQMNTNSGSSSETPHHAVSHHQAITKTHRSVSRSSLLDQDQKKSSSNGAHASSSSQPHHHFSRATSSSSISSVVSGSSKIDLYQIFRNISDLSDLENLSNIVQEFVNETSSSSPQKHHSRTSSGTADFSSSKTQFVTFHPKKGPLPLYLQAKSMHSSFISFLHEQNICSLNSISAADMLYFQYWDLCLLRDDFSKDINEKLRWVMKASSGEFSLPGHILVTKQGPLRLLDKLVASGLDLNARDGRAKETILHVAVRNNDVRLVRHLLRYYGSSTEGNNFSRRRQRSISAPAPVSSKNGETIFNSTLPSSQNVRLSRLNLQAINVALKTPLIVACENESTEIVSLLLEAGGLSQSQLKRHSRSADPLVTTFSPVEITLDRENPEIFALFLKSGMDPNFILGAKIENVGEVKGIPDKKKSSSSKTAIPRNSSTQSLSESTIANKSSIAPELSVSTVSLSPLEIVLSKSHQHHHTLRGTPAFILIHRLFHGKHNTQVAKEVSEMRILRMLDTLLQQKGTDMNFKHPIFSEQQKDAQKETISAEQARLSLPAHLPSGRHKSPKSPRGGKRRSAGLDESKTLNSMMRKTFSRRPSQDHGRSPSPSRRGSSISSTDESHDSAASRNLPTNMDPIMLTPILLLKQNLLANPKEAVRLLKLTLQQQLNFISVILYANGPKPYIKQEAEELLKCSLQSKIFALSNHLIRDLTEVSHDTLLIAIESSRQEAICLKLFSVFQANLPEDVFIDYEELLRCACENGMDRLAEQILEAYSFDADPELVTEAAITAVCNGFLKPIDVLEKKNFVAFDEVIQYRDFNENTPLHLSVNNTKLKPKEFGEMISRLKENDFSLTAMNNDYQTAADVCLTQVKRFDLAIELAQHGVSISRSIFPPFDDNAVALCASSSSVSTAEFKRLINVCGGKKAAQYRNRRGTSALHIATQHNRVSFMRLLLSEYEVDVHVSDENLNTPLHYASSVEALELLLEYGASPNRVNSSKETALHKLCQSCRLSAKNEMQRKQKEIDFQLVRILLENGAETDLQDSKGCTPLHYACLGIHAKTRSDLDHHIFRLLMDYGANPTIHNASGDTPLHLAVHRKLNLFYKKYPISLLIKRGAIVNAENKDRLRPIHFFEGRVNKKNQELIRLLVQHGADYDCSNCFDVMKDAVGFMKAMDALVGNGSGESSTNEGG